MQKRISSCAFAFALTMALFGMASGGLAQTAPAPNASEQDHSAHHPPTISEAPMAPGSETSSGTTQSVQGDMRGRDKITGQDGMMSGGTMGRGMMGPGMMGGTMMGAGGYGENDSDHRRIGRGAVGPMVMRIIFSLMDADGDGRLSLQEFQAAHERIFKAMDANKDGFVTLEEMQNFMRGIGKPISQQ